MYVNICTICTYLDEELFDVGETVGEQEQLRLHLPEQLHHEVLLHRHAHVVHQSLGRDVPVRLRWFGRWFVQSVSIKSIPGGAGLCEFNWREKRKLIKFVHLIELI